MIRPRSEAPIFSWSERYLVELRIVRCSERARRLGNSRQRMRSERRPEVFMPDYPVAIDRRTDLYGDEIDTRFFKT